MNTIKVTDVVIAECDKIPEIDCIPIERRIVIIDRIAQAIADCLVRKITDSEAAMFSDRASEIFKNNTKLIR